MARLYNKIKNENITFEINDSRHKLLIQWLNNAYAMETSIYETLKGHIGDAKNYPELRRELERHLKETQMQKQMIKKAIESIGGNVSETKEIISEIMAKVQGLTSKIMKEKVLKNILIESSTEALEIASYKQIIIIALSTGHTDIVDMARKILKQDEEMVKRVDAILPKIVKQHLSLMQK